MDKRISIIAAIFAVMLAIAIVPSVLAEGAAAPEPGATPRMGGPSDGPPGPGVNGDTITTNSTLGGFGRPGEGRGPHAPRNMTGTFAGSRGPRNGTGMGNFTGNRSQLREEMQERAKEVRAEVKDKLNQLRDEIKTRREEIKDEVTKFKTQINATRAHMKELQDEYKAQRDDWNDAKKNLSDSCKGTNNTVCKEARAKFNDEGKRFIGNAADQMLTQIADLKVRIQTSVYLDNTTVNSVVGQLDALAAKITLDKQAVDALGNSSDVNATKAAATKLRDDWQSAQVTLRLSRELLTHVQFQRFIDQLTTMSQHFSDARTTLAGQGKNVTQLDLDLASFNTKLNTAATAFANAKTSYVSAMATVKTDADASSLIKSTNDQLKAARDDVQSARDDLRAIIKDIRNQDVSVLNDVAAKIQADTKANAASDVDGGAQ